MDRIAQLDAIVDQFNLNKHPFYQDWRMGTLPVEKLQHYANEYAHFVATIDEGWDTVGEAHYAEEERVHEVLWADFQSEIGAVNGPTLPSTDTLVTAAKSLFADRATALGALYSFEAQQPETSQSKLDGLVEHYAASDKAKEYFRVHAGDVAEAELIRQRVATLSDSEFAQTKAACSLLCAAMWRALDGVYYARQTVSA